MTPGLNACDLAFLGVLGLLAIAGTARALRPWWQRQKRWVRQPDEVRIDPAVVAESVVDMLSRGLRTDAAVEVHGTPIRVRWRIDLTSPRYGFWLVHVGNASYPASDLGVVYAVVESNVAALVRKQRRGGAA